MHPQVRHSSERPVLVRKARVVGGLDGDASVKDVLFAEGRVAQVGDSLPAPKHVDVIEAAGAWLLPGWIDIQVNDVEWLCQGPKSPAQHADRVRQVARWQASHGVTGLILATLAAPLDEVLAYLAGMREARASPESPTDSVFLGALVEGTFMNPELKGAQNAAWVLRPDRPTLDRLIDSGVVKLLNLAPEVSPEAVSLIAHATKRGVVVGAGHAKPHAERLREAVQAGLRYAIHLGNGPTGSSLKAFHDGGMLEEVLRNDDILASVILDGYHVHPDLVRDWIARKEPTRIILTSDAGFAMEPPSGDFEVFGIRGRPARDGKYLMVIREDGAAQSPLTSDAAPLFGSLATMRDVFENAVNLLTRDRAGVYCRRHAALELGQALAWSSQMCSTNPATLLGLRDRGELRAPGRADAVLVDIVGEPGRYSLRLRDTLVG